jgi:hypothetical protein
MDDREVAALDRVDAKLLLQLALAVEVAGEHEHAGRVLIQALDYAELRRLRAACPLGALARHPVDRDPGAVDQRILLVLERDAHQARWLVHDNHVGVDVEDALRRQLRALQTSRMQVEHDLPARGDARRDLGDRRAVDAHLAAPDHLACVVPATAGQLAHERIEHAPVACLVDDERLRLASLVV